MTPLTSALMILHPRTLLIPPICPPTSLLGAPPSLSPRVSPPQQPLGPPGPLPAGSAPFSPVGEFRKNKSDDSPSRLNPSQVESRSHQIPYQCISSGHVHLSPHLAPICPAPLSPDLSPPAPGLLAGSAEQLPTSLSQRSSGVASQAGRGLLMPAGTHHRPAWRLVLLCIPQRHCT